jgi:hypothetical protein
MPAGATICADSDSASFVKVINNDKYESADVLA